MESSIDLFAKLQISSTNAVITTSPITKSRVPDEIILLICTQASRKTLRNLRLTNSTFNVAATPHLFGTVHVKVTPYSLENLESIISNPDLVGLVKTIEYGVSWDDRAISSREDLCEIMQTREAIIPNYGQSKKRTLSVLEDLSGQEFHTLCQRIMLFLLLARDFRWPERDSYDEHLRELIQKLPALQCLKYPHDITEYLSEMDREENSPSTIDDIINPPSIEYVARVLRARNGGPILEPCIDYSWFQTLLSGAVADNIHHKLVHIESPCYFGLTPDDHHHNTIDRMPAAHLVNLEHLVIRIPPIYDTRLLVSGVIDVLSMLEKSPKLKTLELRLVDHFRHNPGADAMSNPSATSIFTGWNLTRYHWKHLTFLTLKGFAMKIADFEDFILQHSHSLKSIWLSNLCLSRRKEHPDPLLQLLVTLNNSLSLQSFQLTGKITSGRNVWICTPAKYDWHHRYRSEALDPETLEAQVDDFVVKKGPFPQMLDTTEFYESVFNNNDRVDDEEEREVQIQGNRVDSLPDDLWSLYIDYFPPT